MTMHAYQETQVNRVMNTVGDMLDYIAYDTRIKIEEFYEMFITSKVAKGIEEGLAMYIHGKSGIDLARLVVEEKNKDKILPESMPRMNRSPEYWAGYCIVYYQWLSSRKFTDINKAVSINKVISLYNPLHEADITKFVSVIDSMVTNCYKETNLKRIRSIAGYSQSQLSKLSGVGLRSIQMYEQKNKDINKASADVIKSLANVLKCKMEDLLEENKIEK